MKKELIENPRKYFEDKFIERYGEGFDFSGFVYVDNNTKCKISCPVHGEFSLSMHVLFKPVKKFACSKCSRIYKKDYPITPREDIVNRIEDKFGDRIDLSIFDYKGFYKKAKFICTEHNEVVSKSVDALLKSDKICKKCPRNSDHKLDTRTEYIRKVKELQGSDFKFTLPDGIDPIPKDLIVDSWCPKCGASHQFHKGYIIKYKLDACKYCRKTYVNNYGEYMTPEQANEPCSLYHVKFYKNGIYQFDKVGICRKGLVWRFRPRKKYGYVIKVVSVYNSTAEDCIKLEHEFMEDLEVNNKRYRVHDLQNTDLCGWTECFIDNDSVAELTIEEYCQNEQS